VRLENITAAEIASKMIAQYVEPDVGFDPKTSSDLSFALVGNPQNPQAS